MSNEILNKVASSGIEQIDLISFKSTETLLELDLKPLLFNEFVLKEKDFRDWIKNHNWETYSNQVVCIYCSNDAIIPAWAYMLLTTHLSNAKEVFFGNTDQYRDDKFFKNLDSLDEGIYRDKRVMVKGCSDIPNPNKAYVELTKKLVPVVKSLMFGEPCSSVPVYKKK